MITDIYLAVMNRSCSQGLSIAEPRATRIQVSGEHICIFISPFTGKVVDDLNET